MNTCLTIVCPQSTTSYKSYVCLWLSIYCLRAVFTAFYIERAQIVLSFCILYGKIIGIGHNFVIQNKQQSSLFDHYFRLEVFLTDN